MERQWRILLLEDEPLLRGMLAMALGAQGHRILSGGSWQVGESLVRIIGWQWPDLVVCDANLDREPGALSGYLFHARWRAHYPVPPFIFMRGHSRVGLLPNEGNCRVSHILKPFAPADLFLLIRAILAN